MDPQRQSDEELGAVTTWLTIAVTVFAAIAIGWGVGMLAGLW